MAKNTYWLADGYGTAAHVQGADERDRWLPLGWRVTDETLPEVTHVWMRHEVHGGRARFPAAVVELWQSKGWHPSDPPPVASPFNADQPADVATGQPAAAETTTPSASAAGKNTSSKETRADG